jgi:hypothetical protein
MSDDGTRSRWVVAPLASLLLGLAWFGLALRSPTTTYHLLPAAVAAGWPAALHRSRGRLRMPAAVRAGAGGLAVALGTAFALAGRDALRGPALVGGSALAESLLVAAAGTAVAVRWVGRERTDRPSVQGAHAHQAEHDEEEPDREQDE